jgi:hypothetical protein
MSRNFRVTSALRAFAILFTLSLGGCDTIAWGYVNRLPYRVIIVEHCSDHEHRIPLEPGQHIDPGSGRNHPFDLLGPDNVSFAHYRPSQLRVIDRHAFSYVVIRRGEVTVEPKEQVLADLFPGNM